MYMATAFEVALEQKIKGLEHGGYIPVQNGIIHFLESTLRDLPEQERPPGIVMAFEQIRTKFLGPPPQGL